jgi:hypothetical protein
MSDIVESRIKAYLTPILITCFGAISWSLISEIRTDVKLLLEANAQTQVKIQQLEKRLDGVENVLYSQRMFALKPDEVEVPRRKK